MGFFYIFQEFSEESNYIIFNFETQFLRKGLHELIVHGFLAGRS